MTEAELETVLDEMYAMLGILPSPEQEPKQFASKVKLYKHLKGLQAPAPKAEEIAEANPEVEASNV